MTKCAFCTKPSDPAYEAMREAPDNVDGVRNYVHVTCFADYSRRVQAKAEQPVLRPAVVVQAPKPKPVKTPVPPPVTVEQA